MSKDPRTLTAQGVHSRYAGSVIPPLSNSTTFLRGEHNELLGPVDYRRPEGPLEQDLCALLSKLEGGEDARLFASGLAAAMAVFDTVSPGGTVLAQTQMYYGAKKLLLDLEDKGRLRTAWFDPSAPETLPEIVSASQPEMIWIETPANPSWAIVDIARTAEIARSIGAVLAVDSTSAPPCKTRSLELGADLVMHSATKYLNGHSDVLAGAVITSESNSRWERLCNGHALTGAVPGALETWLLLRGLRTLFVRFDQQSKNAMQIAKTLQLHPKVETVLYPGLDSHRGHSIAEKQMTGGFGGLLSVLVTGGKSEAAKLSSRTKVFQQATSIGGVESLIEHRKPIEGDESPTPDNLVRLSVGIEALEDLVDDLHQALDQI